MSILIALFCGLVMGLGIIVSDMSNPGKILGFLDIGGMWDPSLGLVMGTAILVAMPAFILAEKREKTLTGTAIQLPTSRQIDLRLIGGSVVFGIGWGLTGVCPGPALIMLGRGLPEGVTVVCGMVAGFAAFELSERLRLHDGHSTPSQG